MTRKERLVKWLRKKTPEALVVTVDGKDNPVAVADTRTKWNDTAELIESFAWQRLQGYNADDQVVLNVTPEDLEDPEDQPIEPDEILTEPPELNADESYDHLAQMLQAQRFTADLVKEVMREVIGPVVGPITRSYADLVGVLQASATQAERSNMRHMETIAAMMAAAGGAPGGAPSAGGPEDGWMGKLLANFFHEYTKLNPDALGSMLGFVQGIFGGGAPPPGGGEQNEPPKEAHGGNNDPNKQAE